MNSRYGEGDEQRSDCEDRYTELHQEVITLVHTVPE